MSQADNPLDSVPHDASTAQENAGRWRTLLIGTGLSVGQLHHSLQTVNPSPDVVGCLLPTQAAYNTRSTQPN
jgi:hypothetical protein